ncbi:MAG: c-type cytochrome [Pseudomonadales bacterium]|nr:c-type cytochrome [Pseudomonadales bacterium]
MWRLLFVLLLAACGGQQNVVPETALSPQALLELRTHSEAYAGIDADSLRSDPAALALGAQLYAVHCASCHGADHRGVRGATDLAKGAYDYGASAAAIRTTISQGRTSVMPALGRVLGEMDIGVLVAYVQAFSSGESLSNFEQKAQTLYRENCIDCHGPEGRGNPELGVPNLRDDYWQHGGAMMNIRLAITRGVESQCPPQGEGLTAGEIELLTAHVLQIGNAADAANSQ